MKINLIWAVTLIMVSCNQPDKTDELRSRAILDSVNNVNLANEVRENTIDSLKRVEEMNKPTVNHHSTVNQSSHETATQSGTITPEAKKGMSNRTKGALIGAGTGIVTGAVTGAATSKNKGKGAIIGGAIGGAVGSGVGYGIGTHKDKKDTVK